jgi:ribosome biogenesis protein MAK21
MKAVVAREVSALVLKPPAASQSASAGHMRFDDEKPKAAQKSEGVSHARYYGLITLNQITLTKQESEVATRLVELYFEVFREILGDGKGEEEEEKPNQVEKVAGKVDKWRGRRKGSKPKGGRKTALEEEVVDNSETRLVAAVLTGINRALPFAKLDEEMLVLTPLATWLMIGLQSTWTPCSRSHMREHSTPRSRRSSSSTRLPGRDLQRRTDTIERYMIV